MTFRSDKGSVLIFTLVLALALCVTAAAYLRTAETEYRLSVRSLNVNRALHLAEAGIEEAMWALNNGKTTAANGWTKSGSTLTQTLTTQVNGSSIALDSSSSGQIRIRIDDATGATPIVTAMGIATHTSLGSTAKQVRVTLARTSGSGGSTTSSGAGFGLISKNNIVMNNAEVIDSYDSSKGAWDATTNRNDRIYVVSTNGNIQIQNSNIYGITGVGSPSKTAVSVTQGSLKNGETDAGTKFDQNLITTSVAMNLPAAPPSPVNSGQTAGIVLPENLPPGEITLGYPNSTTPTYYYTTGQNVNLNDNTSFNVVGPVVLVVNGQLSINRSKVQVEASGGAALTMYVSGNINANGSGDTPAFHNKTNTANNLVVFANGAAGQNLAISGAGVSTFAFYGPQYNVNVNGNGHWSGSIVANYISLGGSFHYDEQVDALNPGTPRTSPGITYYAVTSWRELTGQGAYYARDTRAPF